MLQEKYWKTQALQIYGFHIIIVIVFVIIIFS